MIGVDPTGQGRGLGSALISHTLARADAEEMPAYLDATSERSVPLYERHGFEVTEEFHLPKGGPPLWRMWRDPQPR
jgi:ribosomal protein S18 acetylase RimI-like enzyme